MSAVATAIIGSAVIGGTLASKSAGQAADAQVRSTDAANATQLEMFNQNRADQEPWRTTGVAALGTLAGNMDTGGDFSRDFTLADFAKDPGYDFRMQEGQRGLDASAAARGGALSGAAIKGSQRYGQDYASGEFQNAYNRFNNDRTTRFNRLSSLAGVGQTAVNQVNSDRTQTATNIGNNTIGAGNARASGYMGQGNAMSQTANTLGNFAMQQQFMPSYSNRPGQSNSVALTDGTTFYN